MGQWLGVGIANLAAAVDPGTFVIGGGLSEAGELLLAPARDAFQHQLTGRRYRPEAAIVQAELGNTAGFVGAADLARPFARHFRRARARARERREQLLRGRDQCMTTLVIEEVAFDQCAGRGSWSTRCSRSTSRGTAARDETAVDPGQFAAPYGAFFVATVDGEPIGCGGLRRHEDGVVEIKRMFVRSAYRRRGHARALLRALEDRARASGYRRVILETGLAQPEAIALYESEGYQPIDGFGHYKDAPLSRSFAKDLDALDRQSSPSRPRPSGL